MRSLFLRGTICSFLLLSGCAHIYIRNIPDPEVKAFLDIFRSQLPDKYEILSLVVFKYGFFSISSLGMTSFDLARDHLAVAGVTPVGITLFKVISDQGQITESFVIPELSKRGDVAKAVTGNIRDIYFDLSPEEIWSAANQNGKIIVRTPPDNRSQREYIYSDQDRMLMEKRLYKDGRLFWRIIYSQWSTDPKGKRHPRSVRLMHKAYKYQLLLTVKEIRPL